MQVSESPGNESVTFSTSGGHVVGLFHPPGVDAAPVWPESYTRPKLAPKAAQALISFMVAAIS